MRAKGVQPTAAGTAPTQGLAPLRCTTSGGVSRGHMRLNVGAVDGLQRSLVPCRAIALAALFTTTATHPGPRSRPYQDAEKCPYWVAQHAAFGAPLAICCPFPSISHEALKDPPFPLSTAANDAPDGSAHHHHHHHQRHLPARLWRYPLPNRTPLLPPLLPRLQDYSPHAMAAFRSWLRAQVASLDALNMRWRSEFASWVAVEPPRLQAGTYVGVDLSPRWGRCGAVGRPVS